MKKIQFKQNTRLYLVLSFILPVFGMCMMMLIRGFEPFGKISMLYSDMYHQYYPFFVAFRKALLSGESLLYSWDVGMGMDYLGLISYYLASPLNLLSVLIPESWTLEYFSMLSPIKMGFAGLFFAIFLKKLFNKNDFSITLFGCFYALCAWALGYQWNVMWLDSFALLPLVALGTVSLLQEKKVLLYTVTLFLSIFANYYVGFFICIFVALIFICYEVCRWSGFKRFFSDLCRIFVFSLLAIGITAFLELPAFAALQTTQSSVNKFPHGFKLNIADENTWKGLLDAMRQVAGNMNGSLQPTFKEGLPNLYCGLIANMLSVLFLICKQVKLRDKICSILLLVFFNLSFVLRQLDYIWHGFHFTNMIPYRFSFLYSFVLLYMAYRAYLLRDQFKLWQIITAFMLSGALLFCAKNTDHIYWVYNIVFLLFYLTAMLLPHILNENSSERNPDTEIKFLAQKNANARLRTLVLYFVMVLELAMTVLNMGIHFIGTTVTDYPRGTLDSTAVIQHMKMQSAGDIFYRAESTHSQTLNDGALNGYHGVSTFTSSANVRVTRFMQALGYGAKNTYNRYCFEESSPVSNLFLNLKYMLERQNHVEENDYFTDIYSSGKVHLLENNMYLPLGFMTKNQILNIDFPNAQSNAFLFQNQLLQAATGITEDVWSLMTEDALNITSEDVDIRSKTTNGYSNYTTEETVGGTIIYNYTADRSGLVCIDLDLSKKNSFSVWKNGVQLYSETYSIPQTLSVSQVVPGDEIQIHLTCKKNESGSITIHAGILNDAIFRKAYDFLSRSTLNLTSFENTKIEGTITVDEAGVLYTSIPQDGNWVAVVDGKPVETALVGDAMVALILPEGEHEICFQYQNEAFSIGWKVSLACLIAFLILYKRIYADPPKKAK